MPNKVTHNKCQKDEGEADTGTNTNEVCIDAAKIQLISSVANPSKDQHDQDQEQFQKPEDPLEGAEVVALASHRPGQIPDKDTVQDSDQADHNPYLDAEVLPPTLEDCWTLT